MFPIRDHNPSHTVPVVTYTLIVVNAAIYMFMYWLLDETARNQIIGSFALNPAQLGVDPWQFGWVTSLFLHGGVWHLGFNMLFLWIFGDNLEEQFGRLRFLAFYIFTGIVAGACESYFSMGANTSIIGASGAVAGVMGGYLLLFPRAKVDVLVFFLVFKIPAYAILIFWFATQLTKGLGQLNDGVAYYAHIAGFMAGLVLTIPAWLRRGGTAFWRENHGHPPHEATVYPENVSIFPAVRR